MSDVDSRTVVLPDGRALAVHSTGGTGPLVIAHHGTPGCGELLPAWAVSAADRGIRLVSVTRPGYTGSDRAPRRTVADAAGDCAAVADSIGAEHFTTWGVSGGGPHALACAALLPDRVDAVAVLAGVAPAGADGLDWLAGMGRDNLEEFAAAAQGEAALRAYLGPQRDGLLAATPAEVIGEMASLLPAVDADVLTGPDGASVVRWMVDGLRSADGADGLDGWVDDDLAFRRDWGFDPAAVACPVLLLQGAEDLAVPPAHARWLAGHAGPTVELRELPGEGHLSLLPRVDDVHAWLLDAGAAHAGRV